MIFLINFDIISLKNLDVLDKSGFVKLSYFCRVICFMIFNKYFIFSTCMFRLIPNFMNIIKATASNHCTNEILNNFL